MAQQTTYPPGVPCWVESLQPDPRAALAFYRELFGWDGAGPGPMPAGGDYFVARLNGDDVAGIASLPAGDIAEPAWTTYVRVDSCDATADRVASAGGRVILEPIDAQPAGRLAIVESPTGSSFGLWEPGDREGAQRVNEHSAWAMSTLYTPNLRTALPFYATVFGWNSEPFDAGGSPAALFRLPGYVGGLPQQPVPRDVVAVAIERNDIATDFWSVDFWIRDVDAAVACVAQHGGTVVKQPFEDANFRHAVVADPAGAVFTISRLIR